MSPAEEILMVCLGHEPDPLLESTIEAEGYAVTHVASGADVLSGVRPELYAAVAMVVGEEARSEADVLLREAADRMPSTKFLVGVPEDNGQSATVLSGWAATGRVLWIPGNAASAENVRKIRRFLHGEGYQWASDIGATEGDTSLLGAASRLSAHQQDELRRLLHFASELSSHTDLGTMLQQALAKYMELLRCDAGSIYLWEEQSETLVLTAAEGPERDSRIGLRQKLGEGLAGWVAEVGEPILVTDSRKVHRLRGRACKRYSNFSCLATPVMHGGQLLGVVCLTMPKDDQPFGADDLYLARVLSQKLGSVMRPITALSELRRLSERLLGAFRSCTDLVIEKDAQVEALRALSCNILDGIPLGVIAYDRELRVRFSNLGAQGLCGLQPAGPVAWDGPPLEDGLDMDRQAWRQQLLEVMETAQECRIQRLGYRVGGQKRILDIHGSRLQGTDGETIGGILTVQDVTEDVEMEAKLSEAERLALMGKIAAKVAHELNNPLDGILRFLNLALRRLEDPERARSYLEESRSGLLRMSNILSQLLSFSRSHQAAGRTVGLSQMIRQSLAMYEQRASAMSIDVRLDVPSDLPPPPSNELWDVFGNVIKNALDAMGENGTLTICAQRNGRLVSIAVSDTGPGVPEELRDKIFEPFFTTRKAENGTGLGLATCRESLRRVGGEINLVPSEQGATFEIVVPVKEETE